MAAQIGCVILCYLLRIVILQRYCNQLQPELRFFIYIGPFGLDPAMLHCSQDGGTNRLCNSVLFAKNSHFIKVLLSITARAKVFMYNSSFLLRPSIA